MKLKIDNKCISILHINRLNTSLLNDEWVKEEKKKFQNLLQLNGKVNKPINNLADIVFYFAGNVSFFFFFYISEKKNPPLFAEVFWKVVYIMSLKIFILGHEIINCTSKVLFLEKFLPHHL